MVTPLHVRTRKTWVEIEKIHWGGAYKTYESPIKVGPRTMGLAFIFSTWANALCISVTNAVQHHLPHVIQRFYRHIALGLPSPGPC